METPFSKKYSYTGESLGRGNCGKVQTVINKFTNKQMAVKKIKITNSRGEQRGDFELGILSQGVGHVNIVQMEDYYVEGSTLYIVMEKMESLFNELMRREKFDECDAAKIVKDVASALEHLHRLDVMHRDVKVENILCSEDKFYPVKLTDFGLAINSKKKLHVKRDESDSPTVAGTLQYIAPEVFRVYFRFVDHYDDQCDMWSLGVVLLEISTGEKPFDVKEHEDCTRPNCNTCLKSLYLSILRKDHLNVKGWKLFSDGAKDLISRLLEFDPKKRYTAEQVLRHPWIVEQSKIMKKPIINNDNIGEIK